MSENILYLEKRGCDISGNDDLSKYSDVGNYRVCTTGYNIAGKDGNNYYIEFSRCDKRRFKNKRTGAPLKKYIIEHSHKLHVSTAFQKMSDDNFLMTYGNINLDSICYELELDYTLKDILTAVNLISKDVYTSIEFID